VAATTTNRALTQFSGDTPSDLFIRDVPDWKDVVQRQDTPLYKNIDTTSAPSIPMHKAEFGWSSPDPVTDTLAVAITTTNATLITVTTVGYYSVGDIILIDSEQMTVESSRPRPASSGCPAVTPARRRRRT
jgi:hypothetical protein